MKVIIGLILIVSVLFVNCASCKIFQEKKICPYGLLSMDKKKSDVEYKIKKSALVVGIIGVETIVLPIILLGYKLFEPDSIKWE